MATDLFNDVCYYIAEGSLERETEVNKLLKRGGALRETFISSLVTHIICDKYVDKEDPLLTDDCHGKIVNSDWVTLSVKCGVLLPTTAFEMSGDKLFTGIVVCPSQISHNDRGKLWALVNYYGGRYQGRLDSKVTHLVTPDPKGTKYEHAIRHNVLVVTPNWIIDSVSANSLLPLEDYAVRRSSKSHTVTGTVVVGASASPVGCARADDGQWHSQGFEFAEHLGEKVAEEMEVGTAIQPKTISSDCPTTPPKVGPITDEMFEGSAVLPDTTEGSTPPTDVGDTAIGDGVSNGSSSNGNGEFRGMEVVELVSSSALNIQEVVIDESQSFSDVMLDRTDSSAVVPRSSSIAPIVASTSVTETPSPSAQSDTCSTSRKRPHQDEGAERGGRARNILHGMMFLIIDYPEVMDTPTMTKWKEVIIRHGGVVTDVPAVCTHVLAQHKTSDRYKEVVSGDRCCVASAHWLNDILAEHKMFPPSTPLHYPLAYGDPPDWCKNMSVTLTNYTGAERELVRDMVRIAGIPFTGHLSQGTTHLICKSPTGRKYLKAVEWGIKIVNSRFVADIMHNGQAPSELFPKYTILEESDEFQPASFEAIKLLKPWQYFIARYSSQHSEWVDHHLCQQCFSGLEPVHLQPTGGDDPVTSPVKRANVNKTVVASKERKVPIVILFTGLSTSVVKKYRQASSEMGATITNEAAICTHLVAPRIARTVKFLSAISVCKHVVTPQWLEDSIKEKTFVDEAPYILHDPDAEEMFAMNIPTSLERAHDRKLLRGLVIHSTYNVMPFFNDMKYIVSCAGGELLTQAELCARYGGKLERLASDGCALIVISCPEDISQGLCKDFYRLHIPVYNAEFILTGVLRQALNYSQNKLTLQA